MEFASSVWTVNGIVPPFSLFLGTLSALRFWRVAQALLCFGQVLCPFCSATKD